MELNNNEVDYLQENQVDYLKFKAFANLPVTAAFAIGGLRDIDYAHPPMNYPRLADTVGVNFDSMVWADVQDHGDRIDRIDGVADFPNHVDALVTNQKGITLMMRVADCIAVLMYDPVHHAIANVHSGWRGTLLRIASKTVERMTQEFGTKPEDVIVVLCPSIGPDHFEVTEHVRAQFEKEYGTAHIKEVGDGVHFLVDSPACVIDSLVEVGVQKEKIHSSDICTVCQHKLIHSYRGCYGEDKMKRNTALICLK